MKRPLTLLFLSFALASCSKKNDMPEYPVNMTFDRIEPTSAVRVFTSGGTMLDNRADSAVVADFLARNYTIGNTWYNAAFRIPDERYGKADFTFYGNDKVKYSGVSEITEVERMDEIMILRSSVVNDVEDDRLITSDFVRYPFNVLQDGRRYRYQYVVHGDERSGIGVSLLSYKLVRYDGEGELESVDTRTIHNELNEAFVETLGENDTLAVRSYVLKYSAK